MKLELHTSFIFSTRYRSSSLESDAEVTARRSPTISRAFNPIDPNARERQRTLEVGVALHLSRACHGSVSVFPFTSPLTIRELNEPEPNGHLHHEPHLLGARGNTEHNFDGRLLLCQPSAIHGRQTLDFDSIEHFTNVEKKRLCLLNITSDERPQVL